MKLEALQLARQSVSEHRENRYGGMYDEQMLTGRQALARFHASGFSARAELKAACEAFSKAMSYDRRSPESYVALGYVFIMLEDFTTATRLLQEALLREPGHEDALMFLDYIQIRPQLAAQLASKARPLQPKPQPVLTQASAEEPDEPEEIDYDLLYDRTEAQIIMQLQILSRQVPVASSDAQDYQDLKAQCQELDAICERISAELKILDEEIQTDELQTRFSQLERLHRRFKQVLAQSAQLRKLRKEMRSRREETESLSNAIDAGTVELATLQNTIEVLLDACDAAADQLEELEGQGCPIDSVNTEYDRWVRALETLQDLSDDLNRDD